jgi:Tol biopolymer transport system component
VHDQQGERQVSSQGYSYHPRFSSDGSKVFYLVAADSSQEARSGELWVLDFGTGQASKVLPGIAVLGFGLSRDGRQVVFETVDANKQYHFWLASTEHRFAPREMRSASGSFCPQYSRSGRIYFVFSEGGHCYLYRMKDDGTEEEKLTSEPISYAFGISPDERFVVHRKCSIPILMPASPLSIRDKNR